MSIETERPPTPPEVEPAGNGGERSSRPDNSLLGRLKGEFEQRMGNEKVKIAFPGWKRALWPEYKPVPADEFAKKVEASGSDIDANVGFLADACVAVHLRDENGELEELKYEGKPVGYDSRLAELLDIEATSAREVVLWLVNNNTIALNSHAIELLNWMRDTSQEVDGGLLGESST